MHILTKEIYSILIEVFLFITLLFLLYFFVIKKQNTKLNWAIFYSTLYVVVVLPIVNYILVKYNFWTFNNITNSINLPFNLYYLWVFIWAIIPIWLFKGKYIIPILLVLFWVDILFMPILEQVKIVELHNNWIIGDIILLLVVFLPAYYWGTISYHNKNIVLRSLFQVIIMGCIFVVSLPFILSNYNFIKPIIFKWDPYLFQFLFIVILPSIVAVIDLVEKGEGTPFPYDKTQLLVKTGIYAYCRNPIQWSFTFMFIPMAIFFSSYILLLGSLTSIAYVFGVAMLQEGNDMKKRFNRDWEEYYKSVPAWLFLWRPKTIPKGRIYFDSNCGVCSQFGSFFIKANTINLSVIKADSYSEKKLTQVTFIDHNNKEYKSVKALACAFEHINLAYAFLGWLMRLPLIYHLLQLIVDSLDINSQTETCKIK